MPASPHRWPPSWVRWSLWLLYAVAWTTALLVPKPHVDTTPMDVTVPGGEAPILPFGKIVHVSAYAVFAILSGWQRGPGRRRWLLLAFLIFHAFATEYLQTLLPTGRTGQLRDVAFNGAGLVLGVALTWRWWRGD